MQCPNPISNQVQVYLNTFTFTIIIFAFVTYLDTQVKSDIDASFSEMFLWQIKMLIYIILVLIHLRLLIFLNWVLKKSRQELL